MYDIEYKELRTAIGVFKKHFNGYYSFELANGDIIVFEQVDSSISKEYQLKSNKHIDMVFEITYSESYDEFESDDFIIFKLEDLKLL
ncbi:hypothetical protein [Pseudofulvibacter geojedonensis]|uniref:Uncharacterized protein n=1 Tax=Pseudofulvibacter geojedonensis TaxID=1123758 RepID=A0ABW3I2M7_9FLAO